MKLERYVLLDNNKIYDRNKIKTREDNFPMFDILKQIENDDTDNLCRQLVATSGDATDLIRKGDIVAIRLFNRLVKFDVIEVVVLGGKKQIITTASEFMPYVEIEQVELIYKPIGKNYICVWEEEIWN